MDDGRFDALIRVLGSDASRRRMLAGLLAALPIALGSDQTTAKKKKKCKGKKKCGAKCIPKTNCCTDNDCDAGKSCTNGACTCTPNCIRKRCGNDGCGGSCGTCQGGSCGPSFQCVCPFPVIRTPPCDPGSCPTCSPGVCCPTNQTCLNGACASCPEAPDACEIEQEHFCGTIVARFPFCYCATSIDDETTCTSVFADEFQPRDCTSDADCATLVDLNGAEVICVHAPCLGEGLANPTITKVCINKGCVNPFSQRNAARANGDASGVRQFSFRGTR